MPNGIHNTPRCSHRGGFIPISPPNSPPSKAYNASAALAYDITDDLTAGVKVSYDDAFETRVMATINWSFGNLIRGDEAEKQAGLNWLMNALSASPENRDVRVHDAYSCLTKCYPDPECHPQGRCAGQCYCEED